MRFLNRYCNRIYAVANGGAGESFPCQGDRGTASLEEREKVMGRKLNERQKEAVCHETGPMLVLAGPGSGKTTVLLCRILRLLENGFARPQEILALTFSKAAAEEMKERFQRSNVPRGVSFATFHSVFFRILRKQYGWDVERVFREEERRSILRGLVEQEQWEIADIEEYISVFLAQLSLMNSELETVHGFQPEGIPRVFCYWRR